MLIEPKFKIGQIVAAVSILAAIKAKPKNKYSDFEAADVPLFQVLGITSETCTAGTQIHYILRPAITKGGRRESANARDRTV